MKPIVKIFLCIGIFLLILAIIAYGYLTYSEGFQPQQAETNSFCANTFSNTTQCIAQCESANNPDPNALAPETSDEQLVYDIYESFNLQNLITGLPPQTTPIQPYNLASALSAFDMGAPTPWDYDNISLDPQLTLWGTVHPAASKAIFTKAYTKATMSSADSANFIQSNPTNGKNTYTSTLFFGASVPNGQAAMGLQFAEGVVNLGIMLGTQKLFEVIGHWNLAGLQRHNAILAASQNPVNMGLTYEQIGSQIDNMAEGQSKIIHEALDTMTTNKLMESRIYRTLDGKGLNFLGKHVFEDLSTRNGRIAAAIQGSPKPEVQQRLSNLYGDLSSLFPLKVQQ
jgi:hypothetical protein